LVTLAGKAKCPRAATQIMAFAREQGFDGPGAVDTSWRWPAENPGPF
jgi:hypothetical protein